MGCLIAIAPTVAAMAVLFVLFPVNPMLGMIVSTAVWFALTMKIWGGGGGGDGRYDEAGGPFNVD